MEPITTALPQTAQMELDAITGQINILVEHLQSLRTAVGDRTTAETLSAINYRYPHHRQYDVSLVSDELIPETEEGYDAWVSRAQALGNEIDDAITFLESKLEPLRRAALHVRRKLAIYRLITNAYNNKPDDKNILMMFGDSVYPLNADTLHRMEEFVDARDEEHFAIDDKKESDADYRVIFHGGVADLNDITFKEIPITNTGHSDSGGFFNYVNTTDIDLKALQIYTKEDLEDPELQDDIDQDCLLHSIAQLGVPHDSIRRLSIAYSKDTSYSHIKDKQTLSRGFRHVPKRFLTQVATILGRVISVHSHKVGKARPSTPIYRPEGMTRAQCTATGPPLNLALFLGHYFPRITVAIAPFALKNYDEVKDYPGYKDFVSRRRKPYETNHTRCHSMAVKVVKTLYDKGLFKADVAIDMRVQHSPEASAFVLKDNLGEYCKPVKPLKKKEDNTCIYYFDIETCTEGRHHTPFLYGIMEQGDKEVFVCSTHYKMLDWVVKRLKPGQVPIMYAHNAKYDYSVGFPGILRQSELVKDGQFYSAKILHKNRVLEIRDSYKHLDLPLAKFRSTFSLDVGKKDEFIPYDLYTKKSVGRTTIPVRRILEHPKYIAELHDPLVLPYIRGNEFSHMSYMWEYLKYDVLTLRAGFLKQRESMKGVTDLDLYNAMTSSSLADYYFKGKGCYKGVYQMHGELKDWVMNAAIGGRVMTNEGKKHDLTGRPVMDFDAVSLYPSAIKLMRTPIGIPKRIIDVAPNTEHSTALELGDEYYIAEVMITKVGKKRCNPFMTRRGANGGRMWTNDMVGVRVIIDKITLEDYVEFHEIEYVFLQGIQWETSNTVFAEEIVKLFQHRLDAKAELKAATTKEQREYFNLKQQAIKNLMNMSYGKNGTKASATKIDFRATARAERYIIKNFQQIISYNVEKNYHRFNVRANTFNQGNRCHVFALILSLSKRIMNRVMATAEDNDIPIFYQDTDSMHLYYDDVIPLGVAYKAKYNAELIGKAMGQFHNDLENAAGEPCVSLRCIILGKKCYMDRVIATKDYEDKTENPEVEHHIRMKGVGSKAVLSNYEDPEVVYERLYAGEALEFDLLKTGVKFDVKTGISVSSRKKFTRTIQFS